MDKIGTKRFRPIKHNDTLINVRLNQDRAPKPDDQGGKEDTVPVAGGSAAGTPPGESEAAGSPGETAGPGGPGLLVDPLPTHGKIREGPILDKYGKPVRDKYGIVGALKATNTE